MGILVWPEDQEIICDKIRKKKSPIKYILKTKDDSTLLPIWLKHYLAIAEPKDIVIADNNSLDPDVINIYNSVADDVVIFKYVSDPNFGFHNIIHNRFYFSEFYKAIGEAAPYSILVDTDELLFAPEHQILGNDRNRIISALDQAGGSALPSIWLDTVRGSSQIARIGADQSSIVQGLKWGKPIIPTSFLDANDFLIHNIQFPSDLYSENQRVPLYLLHLKEYSRDQRLRVNREKLVARRFIADGASFESIADTEFAGMKDGTIGRLVGEIRSLLKSTEEDFREPTELPLDCVKFTSSRPTEFGSKATRDILKSFEESYVAFIKATLCGNKLASGMANDQDLVSQPAAATSGTSKLQTEADGKLMDMEARQNENSKGNVENVLFSDHGLVISGWCSWAGSSPDDFAVTLGSLSLPAIFINRSGRPDVRDHHPEVTENSGFEIRVAYHDIPKSIDFNERIRISVPRAFVMSSGKIDWPERVVASLTDSPSIPSVPAMPAECVVALRSAMSSSNCYLEFGTGGSTIMALDSGVSMLVGVESDWVWLRGVKIRAKELTHNVDVQLIHSNIGDTCEWGFASSEARWKNWYGYAVAPWHTRSFANFEPDLILIDGRFRVACLLASLIFAPKGCRIFFDDYTDRLHYHHVEDIVKPVRTIGRMAEFVVQQEIDKDRLWLSFLSAVTDQR
ncbi:hypothetical protein [Agrobacterium tumefaciens]|uniref:hypothetical protein n=1 Tax=Agrobacterium tumefaciens TaxID=358 RepID=UPI003BA0F9C7